MHAPVRAVDPRAQALDGRQQRLGAGGVDHHVGLEAHHQLRRGLHVGKQEHVLQLLGSLHLVINEILDAELVGQQRDAPR